MIERELTYLIKNLPEGLEDCDFKEIIDIYVPEKSKHPTLRIRKNGDKFEVTKKEPVEGDDSSEMNEFTTPLTEEEFQALSTVDGKRVRKLRYFYDHDGMLAEVDVFQDDLHGLILVDFEFETSKEKEAFEMPEFCLADITQEVFTAGGMVCGKRYEDLEKDLDRFEYEKILFSNK